MLVYISEVAGVKIGVRRVVSYLAGSAGPALRGRRVMVPRLRDQRYESNEDIPVRRRARGSGTVRGG
jgi:hypothetical protein